MSRPSSEQPVFRVLLVCTGNICRSALAERLGRDLLDRSGCGSGGAIALTSAGTRAVVGSAMYPDSATVLRGFGVEPGDFRARQLADGMAMDADLVLTMTRAHRRDVLHGSPRALHRTFTLKEAAALLRLVGDDVPVTGDDVAERGRELVRLMSAARSRRHEDDGDDIGDPIGRPLEAHAQAGAAIAEALSPVLHRLAALRGTGDPAV